MVAPPVVHGAEVALAAGAALDSRVRATHHHQPRHLGRHQVCPVETAVPVRCRTEQAGQVDQQADGCDGDGRVGLRRQSGPVHLERIWHLRRVDDPWRERPDHLCNVRQGCVVRQGGALVRSDGHVGIPSVVAQQRRGHTGSLSRERVVHHRQQLRLAIVSQGICQAHSDGVVHITTAAAAHVGVDDQRRRQRRTNTMRVGSGRQERRQQECRQ
mmetsp:Transcript_2448/g.8205  ORF Transcript_2448/g.8205 Transcript_2448/m.8205 type:complete len:214 (-) Transcript_2448:57-698(-)|eukprot:scaffold34378_cov129-Isochrysis_galbana.AAC.1